MRLEDRIRLIEAIVNDTAVVVVDPVDCGCCGGLNEYCVHCTDHGGPCPINGCPIPSNQEEA